MTKTIELSSPLSFLILHELNTVQTGTELAKKIGDRKGGTLLTPGTIYPALKLLEEKKLITHSISGREKHYSLTAAGKQELAALYKEFSQLFRGLRHKIRPVYKKKSKKEFL